MSAEPKPSATVILIRDSVHTPLELLLLQRRKRDGGAGPWVFPGGKVDPDDRAHPDESAIDTARNAAVRETHEEAGLAIEGAGLLPISRWITPDVSPKRFDTWFFVGRVPDSSEVRVDGQEMCNHRWLSARAALDANATGEINLAPPTFVSVSWLAEYGEVSDALHGLSRREVLTFRPRLCPVPEGMCMLYPGDAGYDDGNVERVGPRHRLWSLAGGWRYERD